MISARFDIRDLRRLFTRIELFVTGTAMSIIAPIAKNAVRSNSLKGIGAGGKSFAPYTPEYAEWRRRHGLPATPVNLKVTGDFLASIDLQGNLLSVPEEKEGQAEGLLKKRDWRSIDKPAVMKMEQSLVAALNRLGR